MRTMSATDAKYGLGRLIDMARAEPVVIAKHGRSVVVVLAIEEFERLKGIEAGKVTSPTSKRAGTGRARRSNKRTGGQ